MSQRAGDIGSIYMGCSNTTNLKKYGSEEACLDAKLPKNTLLSYAEQVENEKKLRQRNTILFALLIVGGYFAYKKFKK
tara:strand:+ start:5249 stop:5482 length:234 start_codon:yes stop_codon:yes gene_type:complete